MTKSIKDLFEVYRPKAKDEADFVDKHVTIKHKDRNGNGDDVFKGNTKYIKRKAERHGYDVGEDEKVYEETEELDELSTDTLRKYREKARDDAYDADAVDDERRFRKRAAGHNTAGKKIVKKGESLKTEEAEQIDELSHDTLKRFAKTRASQSIQHKLKGDEDSSSKAIKSAMKAEKKMKNEEVDQIFDLIMNSLINAAEELGEEFDLETLEAIAEEVLDEVTITTKSAADAYAQHTGQVKKKTSVPKDPKTGKTLYQKVTSEEAEQIDETKHYELDVSGEYGNKAADRFVNLAKKNGISAKVHTYNGPGGGNPVVHLSHSDHTVIHKFLKKHYDPHMSHDDIERHRFDEAVKNPYAVGMAQAMKSTGDTPPLKKSTIIKAHQIAKKVDEEVELEEGMAMWKVQFPKQHAGKAIDAGTAHVKAQNVSHAHRVMAKRLGVDHKLLKAKVSKSSILPEEAEQIDEISDKIKSEYSTKATQYILNKAHSMDPAEIKKWNRRQKGLAMLKKEEAEQIDELSTKKLSDYRNKSLSNLEKSEKKLKGDLGPGLRWTGSDSEERKIDNRKTGIERSSEKLKAKTGKYNPHPTIGQRIKNALKIEEVEEVDQIDELSPGTLGNYVKRSQGKLLAHGMELQRGTDKVQNTKDAERKINNRFTGVTRATNKLVKKALTKEEAENLDEISKPALGRYINKAKDHIDTTAWRQGYREAGTGSPSDRFERKLSKRHKGIETAVKKLTKEDIINRAIERYIPEDIELPSMEDRLLDKLEQYNLSESHIHTLLSVFESLNEQNQHRMLENVDTVEGVNSLLDFAISHRGE